MQRYWRLTNSLVFAIRQGDAASDDRVALWPWDAGVVPTTIEALHSGDTPVFADNEALVADMGDFDGRRSSADLPAGYYTAMGFPGYPLPDWLQAARDVSVPAVQGVAGNCASFRAWMQRCDRSVDVVESLHVFRQARARQGPPEDCGASHSSCVT
jgi:hypothetical protein